MDRILVDTGFLVALGRARDPSHDAAVEYLETHSVPMITVTAVVVESCHFLSLEGRRALLEWLSEDGPAVIEVPAASYADLAKTMERYKERDIDFADAALVWLAEETGHRSILTVDEGDFSRFRLKGGKRFQLTEWL